MKTVIKKVRAGQTAVFAGISSPYEAPKNPELLLNTAETKLDDYVSQVVKLLQHQLVIGK